MSYPQTPEDQNDFNASNSNSNNNNNNSNSDYPKYKGVRKRKWGKWVSEIRMPNSRERIWLGSFDCPRKAARAFDAAQFCLRGRHAGFNFPESPPDIPGGGSLSPHQIQAVATRFAYDDENNNVVVMGPPPPSTATDHQEAINQDLSSYDFNVDGGGGGGGGGGSTRNEYMDCSFMDILDYTNNNNSGFNYDSFDHFNISGPLYTMHSGEDLTNYGDYDDDPHYSSHQYSSSLWSF